MTSATILGQMSTYSYDGDGRRVKAVSPAGTTIFVYDGYPGGAGFADRGFRKIDTWWTATAAAIEACECPLGCPSCVQSPKCGSGNDPLDNSSGRCRHLSIRLFGLHLHKWLVFGNLVAFSA